MISHSLPIIRLGLSNNYLNRVLIGTQFCWYNHNHNYNGISNKSLKLNRIERYSSQSQSQSNVSHNHSKLWTYERYLSITLLAIMPISLAIKPSLPALDYALALSLVAHIHWGIEAIVVDYVRPSLFGSLIPKISIASLYVLSILSIAGLFYFNYTDVGLVNAIRMIVKL